MELMQRQGWNWGDIGNFPHFLTLHLGLHVSEVDGVHMSTALQRPAVQLSVQKDLDI